MADYGARLFPRAIGYSAGLIDYFFDGYVNNFVGNAYSPNATTTTYPLDGLGSNFYSNYPNAKQPAGVGTISLVAFVMSWPPWNIVSRHVSQPKTVTIVPTIDGESMVGVNLTMDFSNSPFPAEPHELLLQGYVVWRGPVAALINGQVTVVEQDGVLIGYAGYWGD